MSTSVRCGTVNVAERRRSLMALNQGGVVGGQAPELYQADAAQAVVDASRMQIQGSATAARSGSEARARKQSVATQALVDLASVNAAVEQSGSQVGGQNPGRRGSTLGAAGLTSGAAMGSAEVLPGNKVMFSLPGETNPNVRRGSLMLKPALAGAAGAANPPPPNGVAKPKSKAHFAMDVVVEEEEAIPLVAAPTAVTMIDARPLPPPSSMPKSPSKRQLLRTGTTYIQARDSAEDDDEEEANEEDSLLQPSASWHRPLPPHKRTPAQTAPAPAPVQTSAGLFSNAHAPPAEPPRECTGAPPSTGGGSGLVSGGTALVADGETSHRVPLSQRASGGVRSGLTSFRNMSPFRR